MSSDSLLLFDVFEKKQGFGRNGRTYKKCRSYGVNKSNKRWKQENHRSLRVKWRTYFHQETFDTQPLPTRWGDVWSSPKDSDHHSGLSMKRVEIEKRGEVLFKSGPQV